MKVHHLQKMNFQKESVDMIEKSILGLLHKE